LAALTGLQVETEKDLVRAGRAALAKLRAKALLVTRGRNGMALLQPGARPVFIGPHGTKEAVDVTGAGDTGIAAVTLALANVAAAIVVQKPGAATVSREELFAELAAMRNGTSGV
jgi:bifunctional ADP-heptose synthase (sugar kinase/adenylyltransferase)